MADDDLQARITQNTRVLMAIRGIYEQRDLAERMGLQPHDITRRMKGRWQISDLDKLADAFGVQPYDLLRPVAEVVAAASATGTEGVPRPRPASPDTRTDTIGYSGDIATVTRLADWVTQRRNLAPVTAATG